MNEKRTPTWKWRSFSSGRMVHSNIRLNPKTGGSVLLSAVLNRQGLGILSMPRTEYADPLAYGHPNQELEGSEGGYLTGDYPSTTCGGIMAKKLWPNISAS